MSLLFSSLLFSSLLVSSRLVSSRLVSSRLVSSCQSRMGTLRTRTVRALTVWWKPTTKVWSQFSSTDPPTSPPSSTMWPGNSDTCQLMSNCHILTNFSYSSSFWVLRCTFPQSYFQLFTCHHTTCTMFYTYNTAYIRNFKSFDYAWKNTKYISLCNWHFAGFL